MVTDSDNPNFRVKLTDLSRLDNPSIAYEGLIPDSEGFIHFNQGFPWEKVTNRATLKLQVTLRGQPVVERYIHLDRWYPAETKKIGLRIKHNMMQEGQSRPQILHHDGWTSYKPINSEVSRLLYQNFTY